MPGRPSPAPYRAAFAAFALTFLVWIPSLSGSFAKDDLANIEANPVLQRPSEWPRFFYDAGAASADPSVRDTYRPLASLSYGLTARLLGPHPFFFHLADVLGHALNAALVLLVGWELCASLPAAAAGAAWFALHPAQAEGVSYISAAHPGVFSLLLTLLALLLHRGGRRAAALSCFLAATLFKESAVAFAPLFALPFWTRNRTGSPKPALRAAAPFLLVSAAALAARLPVLGGLGRYPPAGGQWSSQLEFALSGLTLHARGALWPYGQRVCYSLYDGGARVLAPAGALLAAAWCAALAVAWRRRSDWLTPLAWGGAALITVSNLVPRPILAADRFLYPFFPAVAWAVALLLARRPKAAAAALALSLLWLTPRCLEQQFAWRSNFTIDLASRQASEDPCAAAVLSVDYVNFGYRARAAELAREALKRRPGPAAEAALRRAVELAPRGEGRPVTGR